MICEQHGKEIIGACQWCGKTLCKFDIGKTMGKKMYCKKCSQEMGGYIQGKQIEQIKEENDAEETRRQHTRMFRF
jgi:hypothetical protein